MEEALKDCKIGTVKRILNRGFGFIKDKRGNNVFFHCSDVLDDKFDDLCEGDTVQFAITVTEKGFNAENIVIIKKEN
jgi:cold shock CspA family protein